MAELHIHLHVRLSPRTIRWTLPALLLGLCAGEIASESFTMTSYYPAPSGIYTQMITTGRTYLARDAGGRVGIGITSPLGKVDVLAGAARTGTHAASPSFYVTGTMQAGTLGPGTGNVEFRHDNATQGIGFGYNTIYQTGTNPNQSLNLQSRGTGALTLNAYAYGTGGVGIGTTEPAGILDVRRANDSGLILRLGTVASVGTFDFSRNASNGNLVIQGNQTGAAVPGSPNASIALAPGIGYVGIGKMSPSTKLDVNGGARVSLDMSVGGNLTVTGQTRLGAAASDPAGINGALYYNSGSNRFRGYKNGAWADLAGSIGWEIIRVANGANFSSAMAFCSAGKKIIGGGCGNYGSDQTTTKKLVWSMPLASDNGWVCYYDLALPANSISAMAICANVGP